MTTDAGTIRPALTPGDWREFLDPANREWAPLVYHNRDPHAAAATGLYGQPFGFTREDVATLREMAESPDNARMERYLNGLADRLAALLPPLAERPEAAAVDRSRSSHNAGAAALTPTLAAPTGAAAPTPEYRCLCGLWWVREMPAAHCTGKHHFATSPAGRAPTRDGYMTPEERAAFDASAWGNAESVEIVPAGRAPARAGTTPEDEPMNDYCAFCYHAKPCGNAACDAVAPRDEDAWLGPEPICDSCGAEAIGHDESGFPCKRTEADVVRAVLTKSRAVLASLRAEVSRLSAARTETQGG